jgi:DNA-binding IclR family transcriptional regulator
MIPDAPTREIQSVRTAFRVVTTIQQQDGATLHELTERLDLAKSTVHNYLGTLESLGYVVEADGSYRLGLRFLTHGMAARNGVAPREAVTAVLPEIAEAIARPAWWVVEEFGRGIFVERAVPDEAAETYGRVGKRSYLHTHAPGKAMLATLPRDSVSRVVERHGLPALTGKTTTDVETLRADLETIRERGWAVSEGEAALCVQSIGVAFRARGTVHALGVFGYSGDFSRNTLEDDVPSLLRDAVADIERALEAAG